MTEFVTIAGAFAAFVGALGAFIAILVSVYLTIVEKHDFRDEFGFWSTLGVTAGSALGLLIGVPFAFATQHKPPSS